MIGLKLYLYDSKQEANGYRGEDFSSHVLQGGQIFDDLTEVMGTAELTLGGLSRGEEFTPKTKFIIDVTDSSRADPIIKTYHVVVKEDVVSLPILSDVTYFDHHISFIEASSLAQGRLVDNMSITYKLQDVTLDGRLVVDTAKAAFKNLNNCYWKPYFGGHAPKPWFYLNNKLLDHSHSFGRQLIWEFPAWCDPYYGENKNWDSLKYYNALSDAQDHRTISIPVPMLRISNGEKDTSVTDYLGYCSVVTTITDLNCISGESSLIEFSSGVTELVTNPSSTIQQESWVGDWALNETQPNYPNSTGKILATRTYRMTYHNNQYVITWDDAVATVANYENSVNNRNISLEIYPNHKYTVQTRLQNNFAYSSSGYGRGFNNIVNNAEGTNNIMPCATLEFMTYITGDDKEVYLKSAPQRNAYELFQKAQLNSQTNFKYFGQGNIPFMELPMTFYLEDEDKSLLQNTTIIENFYNQKNFWEILVDIGKYIHSIPKIEFGVDDRLVVKWQKLGITDQSIDVGTRMSIFNSKSMENYVASVSSYITNLVQMGGVIDEWVAPKSSSEDYLVYNDVAEIKVSKPITEIVSLEAKCVNNTYGITNTTASLTPQNENGYVFEENVYNILSIELIYDGGIWKPKEKVNKGLAIYYTLGTNIIKGFNYQLPTRNTGDAWSGYAIKNILGHIFHIGATLVDGEWVDNPSAWANIKVNDFMFHVTYRTKDSVRTDQTRPDLRKYLISSKYDTVPQHNQFNNQTDIVVDGEKFGNNVYGKLIRTGNTSYTMTEWLTAIDTLQEVGQLYKIRDDFFYVATVKNTYFTTHMVSEITYSKDFNQLSEIIGIPSEPRFYEISEQSLINREVALNTYLLLTGGDETTIESPELSGQTPEFIKHPKGFDYICDLLFHNETQFPKYAITVFKNDHATPSDVAGNEAFYKEVCHPINTYSVQNTLTMEWDMEDNFSAGDSVKLTTYSKDPSRPSDTAYASLNPVKYTDVYGRSDLMDFYIMKDLGSLTPEQIRALPESPVRVLYGYIETYIGATSGSGAPTSAYLDNFVQDNKGRSPEDGDAIAYHDTSVDKYDIYAYYGSWQGYYPIDKYDYDLMANDKIDFSKPSIFNYENQILIDNTHDTNGIILCKDNREKISLNLNVQMLTSSDRMVTSSWLWQPNKGTLRLALLNKEINKISNNTIQETDIITDQYIMSGLIDPDDPSTYVTYAETNPGSYSIRILIENCLNNPHPKNGVVKDVDFDQVKAIAIVSNTPVADNYNSGARYFVCGKNVSDLSEVDKKKTWYITIADKSMFKHQ